MSGPTLDDTGPAGNSPASSGTDEPDGRRERLRRTRRLLGAARNHLTNRALHLIGFVVFAIPIMQLIPGLENALKSLQNVKIEWVIGAMAVETLSEIGYVVSWRGILDPDHLLRQGGPRQAPRSPGGLGAVGSGLVVPGARWGAWASAPGCCIAWVCQWTAWAPVHPHVPQHHRRRPGDRLLRPRSRRRAVQWPEQPRAHVAPRSRGGNRHRARALGRRRSERVAGRFDANRPKVAKAIRTLAEAVGNTKRLLRHRGSTKIVVGALAYLGFDMAVLQGAFVAIDAHPVPTFAVVSMCYLMGGLFGSIPLPANLGAVGGMVGMLTLYGVNGNDATAAVVLYQSIGYIVPLIGGGLAYLFLRREFASMEDDSDDEAPGSGDAEGAPLPAS